MLARSPPYYPWPNFPYTKDCYFDSTGVYKIKPHSWSYPTHGYTRYCFWITAKHPDPHSHKQCRNFDLWAVNFRVHHDCEHQVRERERERESRTHPSSSAVLVLLRTAHNLLTSWLPALPPQTQVSDLTWNGQPLSPVWAENLPHDKSMLQVTRGGNSVLDTQASIASYKAKICFTLPNWCPLEKFCKDKKCKAAFYPSPYTGLKCCPSWECPSQTHKWG